MDLIIDVLYRNGTISTVDGEKAVFSTKLLDVFNAGKAAKGIEHDFSKAWDDSELAHAYADVLKKHGVILGNTYYKGVYYEVFVAGYKA